MTDEKMLTRKIAEGYLQDQRCDLSAFTALEDEAAEILSSHPDFLNLDGLKTLSDRSAEWLGRHVHSLYLNGVASLSDAAAAGLGAHQKNLRLNGLANLTQVAAENLSSCRDLELDGLTSLDAAAASALSKKMTVRCDLTNRKSKVFGKRSLQGIIRIEEEVADNFVKTCQNGFPIGVPLSLRLKEWPSTAGHLALAKAITQKRGPQDTTWEFERLEEFSPELAAILANSTNHLVLDRVESVTVDEARLLSGHKKGILRIGVKRIDAEAAGLLARHGAKLFMPRLESLEDTKQHRRLLKKLVKSFYKLGQAHAWGGNCLGFRALPLWMAEEILSSSNRDGLRYLTFTQLERAEPDALEAIKRVRVDMGLNGIPTAGIVP